VESVLAARMSKTGVADVIGGVELLSVKITFEGFRRGFLATRPDGRVLTSYIGSFNDVGAAKEAARRKLDKAPTCSFRTPTPRD
ncbi:MAG: BMP family ABC transporter substrate-binding protein, partial [Candidatus Binataceae bacterium]